MGYLETSHESEYSKRSKVRIYGKTICAELTCQPSSGVSKWLIGQTEFWTALLKDAACLLGLAV